MQPSLYASQEHGRWSLYCDGASSGNPGPAGAGFVVALCGEMQRMPGLGRTLAFMGIDVDAEGRTVGLF